MSSIVRMVRITFFALTIVGSAIVPKLELEASTEAGISSFLSSPTDDPVEGTVPVFSIFSFFSTVGLTGVEVAVGVVVTGVSSSTTSSDNISTNVDGITTFVPLRRSVVVFSSDTVSFL